MKEPRINSREWYKTKAVKNKAKNKAKNKKWEYFTKSLYQETLKYTTWDILGNEGWELVSAAINPLNGDRVGFFKRQK